MTAMKEEKILVVQYEQFFTLGDEIADLPEAIKEGLENLREYAGAHVVGSYQDVDNAKFRDKARSYIVIDIDQPVKLAID